MTAVTAGGMERPPLKITLRGDEDQEIEVKMSYGLFNDLQRTTPDPAAILEVIASDPYTRDYILRRCLTPTKKMVKDEKELTPPEDIPVDDPDEIDKLMQWVAGHMLYFFATSAGGLKRLGEAFKVKLNPEDRPAPSTTGSQT